MVVLRAPAGTSCASIGAVDITSSRDCREQGPWYGSRTDRTIKVEARSHYQSGCSLCATANCSGLDQYALFFNTRNISQPPSHNHVSLCRLPGPDVYDTNIIWPQPPEQTAGQKAAAWRAVAKAEPSRRVESSERERWARAALSATSSQCTAERAECAGFCKLERAVNHCKLCRCARCAYCARAPERRWRQRNGGARGAGRAARSALARRRTAVPGTAVPPVPGGRRRRHELTVQPPAVPRAPQEPGGAHRFPARQLGRRGRA